MAVAMACGRAWSRMFLKKPMAVCLSENSESKLEKSLSLVDLLAIGIGGTVGSGVFVLTGLIANEYAGPGVVWSWAIAGFGCMFSAMSYAEMASRVPSAGSSYAYVYYALGEMPAFVAAWCLTLEYGISGAAVARSWGEKVLSWTDTVGISVWGVLEPGLGINLFAGFMQLACMLLLLAGIEMGKLTVNFFTILKIILVAFMIIAGLSLFKKDNVSNWAPNGFSGIMRGATSAFFGFLGYDEVCCLAAEAQDPQRTLPKAVFGTIGTVTILYCLASLALVGMMPYDEIDTDSGFSDAFKDRGHRWAQQLVAIGEIITLPLVVLISFLAQPRLMYAMAEDGLLPRLFAEVDSKGNLTKGIVVSGLVCTLIALFIPFKYLDDMISAGVLLSFNMTNVSLIVVRRAPPKTPQTCKLLLFAYNVLCFISSMLFVYVDLESIEVIAPCFITVAAIACGLWIAKYPENDDPDQASQYRVPCMPYFPLFGIYVNYFLVAQLKWWGVLLIFGYMGLAMVCYLLYGLKHSVGNNGGWKIRLRDNSDDDESNQESLLIKRFIDGDLSIQ